jgi:cell shape-determining protein MreC
MDQQHLNQTYKAMVAQYHCIELRVLSLKQQNIKPKTINHGKHNHPLQMQPTMVVWH